MLVYINKKLDILLVKCFLQNHLSVWWSDTALEAFQNAVNPYTVISGV